MDIDSHRYIKRDPQSDRYLLANYILIYKYKYSEIRIKIHISVAEFLRSQHLSNRSK